MLPRKIIVRKTRWVWIVFMVLAPLAYAAGVILTLQHDPMVHVGAGIDRGGAVSIAARFAAGKGIDVGSWDQFCRVKAENNLLFYYRLRSDAERNLARSIAPETVVAVRFRSPDKKENIEVLLGMDGRILGYERRMSRSISFVDPGETVARKVAEAAVRARLESAGISQPIDLKQGEVVGDGGQVRRYVWRWPLSSMPELKLESIVSVRADALVTDQVVAKVDESFARQYLHSKSRLRIISIILYGLITFVVVVFGIYRFIQRTRQKEVSYSRAFLLSLVFAAIASTFILVTDVAIYEITGIPDFPAPDLVILFSASMIYLLVALFLGLAYGSGEGDIREANPGKLSSLDALLTGKIFSRNVARSVVSGWAFGGWILLCMNAVVLPWQGKPAYGEELTPLDAWFGKLPWLSALLGWPMDVILIIVIGLLIPLPLFQRRFRSPRIIVAFLAFFMWAACSGPYLTFRPHVAILAMAAVRTFFAMIAFFRFDLLTAIVGLASPTFVAFATALMAQPSQSLRSSGAVSLIIALIVLTVELFFAFKGRLYKEDEVRPVYAKHLAERLSMQAEVSAAREAQKRLMPNDLPQNPHFSIAASCIPAFEVGGDFYDLFEIEPGKLGVLIAEGGGKGLGSALSIAFAKGFLLPKILGSRNSDDSPSEIIRGLQDRLMMRLEEGSQIGIAYAVIDATDGSLRYARTAAHPSILVERPGSDNLVQPVERALRFKSNLGVEKDVCLVEGSFTLRPGDSVAFFTDGVAKDWADNGSSPQIEFAKVIAGDRNGSMDNLQESLAKAVKDCFRRVRKRGVEDDLTAVVVRLEKPEALTDASSDEENNQ
jgi:serine phosphatase RsbU (regulator of sigma subunit)